ncbi:hypothetical protein CN354_28410 [Bacillus cereus]|nr:hypothetical protein CN354_28410 [Bacillus cereus]
MPTHCFIFILITPFENDRISPAARHNWTLALVVSFVEQKWQKKYTLRGMSRLLRSLGLSYSKATYTLAQGDTVKQAAFREETFPA